MSWHDLLVPNGKPPEVEQPLLEFQNLSAGYNGHAAIHDINLRFYAGEFAALVGDNGAGKSTLALAAAGLIRPLGGKVLFSNGTRPRPGQDIALLFQNPADQLFTDSVDEEIAFGPRNYRCLDPMCTSRPWQMLTWLTCATVARFPFQLVSSSAQPWRPAWLSAPAWSFSTNQPSARTGATCSR